MKRMLLLTVIFFTTIFLTTPSMLSAQEVMSETTENQQMSPSTIVQYDLAYPGILPDYPLYKLKVLRDRISLALISDPKKRVEFYLLKTDKGILATAILIDKGLIDLAAQTALKAEHNYTLLTRELHRLPTAPKEELYEKLKTASLKHQEVLASLAKRVTPEKQKTFLTVIEFSKRNWESVEEYKHLKEEQQKEIEEQ